MGFDVRNLATWPYRIGMFLAVISAVLGWREWDKSNQRAIGAEKVIVASKKEGAVANAKNEAVRADAERPGAADRVRKLYCRNC